MWTQTHRERTSYEDRGRDGSSAAASQAGPRTADNHRKPGRGKEGFYPEPQREPGPANTLILDQMVSRTV